MAFFPVLLLLPHALTGGLFLPATPRAALLHMHSGASQPVYSPSLRPPRRGLSLAATASVDVDAADPTASTDASDTVESNGASEPAVRTEGDASEGATSKGAAADATDAVTSVFTAAAAAAADVAVAVAAAAADAVTSAGALSSAGAEDVADAEQQLLQLAETTDHGVRATEEQREQISQLVEALEFQWRGTNPFSAGAAPLLLRETEVAYVGQNSSMKASGPGGNFLQRLRKLIFRTEDRFQHILEPDIAVNVVRFRLFGLLPGAAVRRGQWSVPTSTAERGALQRNSTRELSDNAMVLQFEPPRIALGPRGGLLNLRLGWASTSGLDTTYLSPTIRICRDAASGIPFVFRADTVAKGGAHYESARAWRDIFERPATRKAKDDADAHAATAAAPPSS